MKFNGSYSVISLSFLLVAVFASCVQKEKLQNERGPSSIGSSTLGIYKQVFSYKSLKHGNFEVADDFTKSYSRTYSLESNWRFHHELLSPIMRSNSGGHVAVGVINDSRISLAFFAIPKVVIRKNGFLLPKKFEMSTTKLNLDKIALEWKEEVSRIIQDELRTPQTRVQVRFNYGIPRASEDENLLSRLPRGQDALYPMKSTDSMETLLRDYSAAVVTPIDRVPVDKLDELFEAAEVFARRLSADF